MKKIITFFLIIIFSVFLFSFVKADEPSNLKGAETKMGNFAKGLSFITDKDAFDTSASSIIRNIMLLVNTLFFIFMIYAGVLWFISSGEEAKITKAKTIIIWCVVGMAVTLGSYAITVFVLGKISAS